MSSTNQRRNRVRLIFKEQEGVCIYCSKKMWILPVGVKIKDVGKQHGRKGKMATLEHITPLCKGGSRRKRENQAVACLHCNRRRGSAPFLLYLWISHWGSNNDVDKFMKYWKKWGKFRNRMKGRVDRLRRTKVKLVKWFCISFGTFKGNDFTL